jgi:hypothetical protein
MKFSHAAKSLNLILLGNKAESKVYPGNKSTKGMPRTIRKTSLGKNVIIIISKTVRAFIKKSI